MQPYYKIILSVIIVVAMTILSASAGLPENSDSDIDNMKAAFIYNFTKYIKWPNLDNNHVFKIGVLGNSEITISLQELAAKKLIERKSIEVFHFKAVQDLKFCHILFISESENQNVLEILSTQGNRATLTIGESEGFCERGVMINFFLQDGMVKFEMNSMSLEDAGLKVSSQLQKLARIVQ